MMVTKSENGMSLFTSQLRLLHSLHEEGINKSFLIPVIGEIVGQTVVSSYLGRPSSLGEGQFWIQNWRMQKETLSLYLPIIMAMNSLQILKESWDSHDNLSWRLDGIFKKNNNNKEENKILHINRKLLLLLETNFI